MEASAATAAKAGEDAVVVGLNVFPVKSCKAVSSTEVEIDDFGIVGDRRFMVVEGTRFTSQRKLPRMALITVSYIEAKGEGACKKKRLRFSAPDMPDFILDPVLEGERVEVGLWRDTVRVIDQGEGISKWLNEHIGFGSAHLRLVASAEEHVGYTRPISELHVPAALLNKLSDRHMALSDSGPVSLVSHESLVDLNRRLKARGGDEVGLKQFRMNIEVSGCSEAFEEDKWLLVQIGTTPFLAYRDATRCKLTGVHQDTAEQLKLPPLDILRTYRAPRGPDKARFGQLLLPLKSGGKIKIGDRVTVLEYKK